MPVLDKIRLIDSENSIDSIYDLNDVRVGLGDAAEELIGGYDSSTDTIYFRVKDGSGNLYQLVATPTDFKYEKKLSGGSWETVNGCVVLLNKPAGVTSGTLSKNISNFKRLKITWGTSDKGYLFTQEVYTDGASSVSVPVSYVTETSQNGNLYPNMIRINLSGTSLTRDRNWTATVGATTLTSSASGLLIYRVEGYYN